MAPLIWTENNPLDHPEDGQRHRSMVVVHYPLITQRLSSPEFIDTV
jgi:hypothetical protein